MDDPGFGSYVLLGSYDLRLVVLSIAIAIVASYTALDLAGRVAATQGDTRLAWLVSGAVAMGTGVWSMHFIGMLAFCLPVTVHYSIPLMLISVLPAVLAFGVVLFLISLEEMGAFRLIGGSLLMGSGIGTMHYVGMAAVQVSSAQLHYNIWRVAGSIGVAIAVSLAALTMIFHLRQETLPGWTRKKLGAAIVMGAAVPMMHYTGMGAVSLTSNATTHTHLSGELLATADSTLIAVAVSLGTLIVLSLALLSCFFDRRISAQTIYTEALQASQDYLQTILQGIQVGVLVAGGDATIQLNNQAALDLLGLTQEQLHQFWVNHQTSPSRPHPNHNHPVLETIANQHEIQNRAIAIAHAATGEKRWLLVNAVPQCIRSNRLEQVIYTFSDITELKQTEEALRKSETKNRTLADVATTHVKRLSQALQRLQQAQAQLVQQEKMSSLGHMVAGIAHEMNNPVSFVYGNLNYASEYTQSLLDLLHTYQQHYPVPVEAVQTKLAEVDLGFITSDLTQLFRSMKSGADRIRQLVVSLRNFSRLDEAEQKRADIHEGLDNTLLLLQHRLRALPDGSEIQVIKIYGKLPLLECHAGQLNQVFLNILNNAIDAIQQAQADVLTSQASPSRLPQIKIATGFVARRGQRSPRIRITIADTGIAIPKEIKSRIFDPFFTTKPVGQGTGLGLSIAYQIVVGKHKGSLQCFSKAGQGTVFRIELPI
jgi:PAS domain S-box-containing protein